MGISDNINYTSVLNEILSELKKLNEKVDALSKNDKEKEEELRKQLVDATNNILNM